MAHTRIPAARSAPAMTVTATFQADDAVTVMVLAGARTVVGGGLRRATTPSTLKSPIPSSSLAVGVRPVCAHVAPTRCIAAGQGRGR